MANPGSSCVYCLYGLRVRINRPITGLIAVPDSGPIDVRVHLIAPGSLEAPSAPEALLHSSRGKNERGESFFKLWKVDGTDGVHFLLQFSGWERSMEFLINQAGSEVRAFWGDHTPYEDVIPFLLGPVLGRVLRLRGITCLHASVVAVGGAAIAIIGAPAAGKSTTAAALAWRGHPVLSDDVAALVEKGEAILVQPGYPRMRLWPSTVDVLPGLSADELSRVLSLVDKRFVDLTPDDGASQWQFQQEPLPLAAVYVLGPFSPNNELSITTMAATEGLFTLAANAYAGYVLDRAMRAHDFEVLGRLAATIPLRKVHRPERLDALSQISDAILDDIETLLG